MRYLIIIVLHVLVLLLYVLAVVCFIGYIIGNPDPVLLAGLLMFLSAKILEVFAKLLTKTKKVGSGGTDTKKGMKIVKVHLDPHGENSVTEVSPNEVTEADLRTMRLACNGCSAVFSTPTPKGKKLGLWDLFRIKKLQRLTQKKAEEQGWKCYEKHGLDFCPDCVTKRKEVH